MGEQERRGGEREGTGRSRERGEGEKGRDEKRGRSAGLLHPKFSFLRCRNQ